MTRRLKSQRGAIENCNHGNRANVVGNGQCQKKDLQVLRDALDHSQHAQRKRDVGCHGNAPAVLPGVSKIQGHEQQRGNNHASESAENRQRRAAHVGEFSVHDFVLDLHADQEEKDGHQRIVDPGMHRQVQAREGKLHLPDMVIRVMPRRIGPNQGDDRRAQQQHAADALNMNESLDRQNQSARHQRFAQPDLERTVCARRNSHKQ